MQPTLVTSDMRYWRIAPDPRLRGSVWCYWMVEDRQRTPERTNIEHGEDLLIPDGHSEIVFNRGKTGFERWELGQPEQRELMDSSYIIGGRSHSIATHTKVPVRLAGVKLDPRFLRAIIGTPLSEFRDATLRFTDLNNAALRALEDAVANARSVDAIAAHFNQFFLDALRDVQPEAAATDHLLARIQRDRGCVPIMRWAREAGIDSRSLERKFCAAAGMTPKQYARVIRFKRIYSVLINSRGAETTLSSQLEGYYDQSHFNREFRFFTGIAPRAKLAGSMSHALKITDHLVETEFAGAR